MSAVAGRSSRARTATVGITNASAALTGAALTFNEEDAGRPISGTGIPAGATILSVASATSATLSANATATNASLSAVLGDHQAGYGFDGWSPESDAESETYTVAAKGSGATSPDQQANSTTAIVQRERA